MCAHVFINLCYSLPAQLINLSGHQTSTKPYSRAEDSNTLSSCFSHQERGEVSVGGSSEEENQGVSSPFISHQRTHVCSHSQRHWCYWPPKLPHCRATGSLDSQAPLLTEQSVRFRSFYSAVLGSPKKLQWWLYKKNTLWCRQVIRRKRTRTAIKTVNRRPKRKKKKKLNSISARSRRNTPQSATHILSPNFSLVLRVLEKC